MRHLFAAFPSLYVNRLMVRTVFPSFANLAVFVRLFGLVLVVLRLDAVVLAMLLADRLMVLPKFPLKGLG
jgi:hypothetical protein